MKRWRKVFVGGTVGMTIFGLVLSMLHQSTLGALFLTVPTKLHPLWYSPYIPLHFFLSSAMGGISMVILVGMLSKRIFSDKMEISRETLDKLTVGLAKGAAIALAVYFAVKLVDLSIAGKWHYLFTPTGVWFLVEVLGFVLLPCLLFAHGHREKNPRLIRFTALLTVLGIILNRINIAIVVFNYDLPAAERYVPHWMEYVVVLTLITGGVAVFKWIVQRMPVLHDHPDYKASH